MAGLLSDLIPTEFRESFKNPDQSSIIDAGSISLFIFLEAWDETENEIRHRLKDPAAYDTCRYGKDIDAGVTPLFCRRKDDHTRWEIQALRFDKSKFNITSAKQWAEKHKETISSMKESINEDNQEINPITTTGTNFELIEADSTVPEKGSRWDVTIIKAGKSKNKWIYQGKPVSFYYSESSLTQAVNLFEGAPVFAHRNGQHVDIMSRSSHDIVGMLTNVKMINKEMRAQLDFLPSASWLKENLLTAYRLGKRNLYELSIHATGQSSPKYLDGDYILYVESIDKVESVDIVAQGAAGGKFNDLIESLNQNVKPKQNTEFNMNTKQKLLFLFTMLYPTFLESKRIDLPKVDENELYTYLLEADKPQPRLHLPEGSKLDENLIDDRIKKLRESMKPIEPDPQPKKDADPNKEPLELDSIKKTLEKMQLSFCEAMLGNKINDSGLPKPLADMTKKNFSGKIFAESEVDNFIKEIKDTWAKMSVENPKSIMIEAGQDEFDKFTLALDGFFLANPNSPKPLSSEERKELLKNVPPFRSFREAYVMFTGDEDITGIKNPKYSRFSESITTTEFSKACADAMNKALVREYSLLNLDTWRNFTEIVPVKDFKTQHRIRFGGYGNLPTVAQKAPYTSLTSPTDEEATYTPAKKGGTEDISREAIMNDDVGAIRRIPQRLARAAAQTLHEFAFEFVNPATNPTIYDGSALYCASPHVNYGTSALDATYLAAARLRMKKQTQAGSSKRLGLRARYLLVPPDLESTAYGLITPAFNKSNMVPEFLQQIGIIPIVVDYWTDTNDWALVADKSDILGLEIGFVNGQETPEIFISDLPNVGSWFTNDVITYKIRHEYGGAIIDYRAFDGSHV